MAAPIIVTADHAQRRTKRDRLSILAEGSYKAARGGRQTGWNMVASEDVWQEESTWTAMLLPAPVDKANWDTLNTGIYTKYAVADLTFSDASGWIDTPVNGSVGWIKKAGGTNEVVYSPTLPNINQPMLVRTYIFGAADTQRVVLECGWSDDPDTDWIGFRVYAAGDVEVFVDGELVGTGKVKGHLNENWLSLMFMPFRRREILVHPIEGEGFSHVFTHLPEDGTVQEIVPATKFWVRFPTGALQPRYTAVQLAKIQFKTSGNLRSGYRYFADAPPSPAPTLSTEVIADGSGYGSTGTTLTLLESDLSGAFTPDGTKTEAVINVELTGGPSATPFVYAGYAAYEQEVVDSDDSEETEIAWQAGLSLSVPDSPSGARLTVPIRDPENQGIDRLTLIGNRPVHVQVGAVSIMDGRGGPPKVQRGRTDDLTVMQYEVLDAWRALENYRFQDDFPLDGLTFNAALEIMFELAGFDPAQVDIEEAGLSLGLASSPTAGEWSVLVKTGETAAQTVERLFEAYASDWFYGLQPQASGMPKFFAASPTSLSSTPDVELFTTRSDAKAQLVTEGMSSGDAERYAGMRLVYGYSETRVLPEATDVRVTGINLRSNKYLQSKYIDANAQDPEVAPSLRQDNWLGERLRYGYLEPWLTTQALVDDAASKLGDRLTRVRTLIDFQSDFIVASTGVPLWRGGVVRVDGDKKYRVRSLQMVCQKDVLTGGSGIDLNIWRPTTYTAELIDGNPPWAVSTGQIGSRSIAANQLRRLAIQGIRFLDQFSGIVVVDR